MPQTSQVTLAWDANTPAPDGYHIYQRTAGQAYDYSRPVWTTSDNTVTLYNLDYDTTYYYVVRAYVGSDASGDSNEVAFTSPTPAPSLYEITTSVTAGGTISPAGPVSVTQGTDQNFTITPEAGAYIVDVTVDGASVGAVSAYLFTQVADSHVIAAEFAYLPHTVSASAGAGGSISPSGETSVVHGDSQLYTITPVDGYHVDDVVVDGAAMGPLTTYTFSQVAADHTIVAGFAPNQHVITASADAHGTISPAGTTIVAFGGSQTYTITPETGYAIDDVMVDGASVGAVETYTFSNIGTDHTITALFAGSNQAPVADAGPDQTVDESRTVTLSGINSMDPDDGIATFRWRQVQGTQVQLVTPDEPETTFTAPDVAEAGVALVFELTVTDYSGAAATDSAIVNVTWVNIPPTANAGDDQTVVAGSDVVLDASGSSDSDDGIATYAWKQLQGPVVILSDANVATPTFTAPGVQAGGAALTFEVTVTDHNGLQATDTCLINVTWVNTPPVADAGADQEAGVGDEVILDGAGSRDADDSAISSYRWRQTAGAPVELSDATAQSPTFVVPADAVAGSDLTFELTVTDSGGLQATDTCRVTIAAAGPTLHISDLTIVLDRKKGRYQAHAYATVSDEAGGIVKRARVTGIWRLDGDVLNTASGTVRRGDTAKLDSSRFNAGAGALVTLEITDIVKDGYLYAPDDNTVTTQSVSVP